MSELIIPDEQGAYSGKSPTNGKRLNIKVATSWLRVGDAVYEAVDGQWRLMTVDSPHRPEPNLYDAKLVRDNSQDIWEFDLEE